MKTPNALIDPEVENYKQLLVNVCERYSSDFGDTAPVSTLTDLLNNYMLKDGLTVDELVQNTANVLRVIDFITEVYTHVINLETTRRLNS